MDKVNKVFIYIVVTLVVVILSILLYKSFKLKPYSKNYFYLDTYINVKVYERNKKKALEALDEIDKIYSEYHNLTNKYEPYDNGLYNLNKNGDGIIDYRLYEIIRYGYLWYDKTDGLLNIAIGNVTDVWKKYRDKGEGVPSINELQSKNINISDVYIEEVTSDNKDNKIDSSVILSNGVTIDLGAFAKGYITDVVADYLKSKGINRYIINAGGNVLVGKKYSKDLYKIGIEDPKGEVSIFKIVKGENIAVVTSGGYNRNYTYNGKTYNHIIDPYTLYPKDNMLSVTVIADESKKADALSTALYLMDVEKGKEFVKENDAYAIWVLNDGTVITSEGIEKYE